VAIAVDIIITTTKQQPRSEIESVSAQGIVQVVANTGLDAAIAFICRPCQDHADERPDVGVMVKP